jgi:hypothetical protein
MSEVYSAPPPPPPPPPGPPPAPAGPQFDFARPFTYVFDDPRWVQKVLIGGLFYLAGVVIIGWFFVLGYYARVARNIIAGSAMPLPEWDDLGEFFNEGLRLVGVGLVYVLPLIGLVTMVFVPATLLTTVDNEAAQALGGIISGCLPCLFIPFVLAMIVFMPASLLFAAVEQRLGAAFEFARLWAFIRANAGNYLLAIVVWLIARTIGGVGVFLLCIGVIFTAFWSFLITTHAFAQVYKLARR